YAVIAKGPGLRRDRGILIFASHGSAGTDAAVEYLTSRDTINDLAPRLSTSGAGGYQVLLKVLADRDQAFKTEYVTHHESAPPPVGR
ncbi:MAG: hypothetical protein HY821_18305, partial [Acidobacteria bacterium]|nr:hypothetical protein [Acidobacteriota bacterium]